MINVSKKIENIDIHLFSSFTFFLQIAEAQRGLLRIKILGGDSMQKIILKHSYGYSWYRTNSTYIKGYLIHKNELYQGPELAKVISNSEGTEELKNFLNNSSGIFSIIKKDGEKLILATDITRTFPIFYAITEKGIFVSDDTFCIREFINTSYDPSELAEFMRCGYTTVERTLLKGINQVQAGEILIISEERDIKREFYKSYILKIQEISNQDIVKLKRRFLEILDRAINRLIMFAGDRTIVIPLSGGYDSRCIAATLKKNNFENVILYTYGKGESTEVKVARKVAKNLGYEWLFVEQTEDIVDPDYPESGYFRKFYEYAFNHVSVIHMQDFFVFKYLVDNSLIPKESVVVPGHSGDFLGGSHLRKLPLPRNRKAVVESIMLKHYCLNEHIKLPVEIKDRISRYVFSYPEDVLLWSIDDNWNLRERQSKFIVNSNRTYEFFGYMHAIPLWDRELVEFFRRLPIEYKYNRVLYNEALEESIFKELDILMKQKDEAKRIVSRFYYGPLRSSEVFRRLRYLGEKYLPYQIKRPLKDFLWKDENNMVVVAEPVLKRINRKYTFSDLKGIMAEFCLDLLRSYKGKSC
jgi:asparagine synthase (glutamine-hydrolysing)